MTDFHYSYSPLGWDGLSKKTSKWTTAMKALELYWKDVAIYSLVVSTTVLLTLLLNHHTMSTLKDESHSMLPMSQFQFTRLTCGQR